MQAADPFKLGISSTNETMKRKQALQKSKTIYTSWNLQGCFHPVIFAQGYVVYNSSRVY